MTNSHLRYLKKLNAVKKVALRFENRNGKVVSLHREKRTASSAPREGALFMPRSDENHV